MKPIAISILVCLFSLSVPAQIEENFACREEDKRAVREYFEKLDDLHKFIAEQEEKAKQEQIKNFGAPAVRIIGFCEWSNNGCPLILKKPSFPRLAKTLKISGQVITGVIVNEEGKIISAKVLSGHPQFRQTARKAACQSLFYPKTVSNQKIKPSLIIVYNFVN